MLPKLFFCIKNGLRIFLHTTYTPCVRVRQRESECGKEGGREIGESVS